VKQPAMQETAAVDAWIKMKLASDLND